MTSMFTRTSSSTSSRPAPETSGIHGLSSPNIARSRSAGRPVWK